MLISQQLFDETLLETQELFEYSNDQAVQETVVELTSTGGTGSNGGSAQPPSLDHLTLTHPESSEGQADRALQLDFVKSLQNLSQQQADVVMATRLLTEAMEKYNEKIKDNSSKKSNPLLMIWSLILQQGLWREAVENTEEEDDIMDQMDTLTSFVVALLPDDTLALSLMHPMSRALKLEIAPSWFFVLKTEKKHDDEDGDDGDNNNSYMDEIIYDPSRCHWFKLLDRALQQQKEGSDKAKALIYKLMQMARKLCNGCEDNKKAFVQAAVAYQSYGKNGLELLVECLGDNVLVDRKTVREACQLIAILGKFQPLAEPSAAKGARLEHQQPGGRPLVSAAHANVKELHKAGAVPSLHRITKQPLSKESETEEEMEDVDDGTADLLCDALAALRVMAIDNDIVQNMIALGILGTVHESLKVVVEQSSTESVTSCLPLATATFGLVRNLCANDEVKTTICKSSLPSILCVMQNYLLLAQQQRSQLGEAMVANNNKTRKGCGNLQEHACGILGAMALRQPNNAESIIGNDVTMTDDGVGSNPTTPTANGHVLILEAMKAFPDKVTLQRQACLAMRNIASRLSESDKARILEAGAEDTIQRFAGKHPASSEEAYAALRDLGKTPDMYDVDEYGNVTNKSATQAFGKITSNFRAVYDE
ncbi:MAG: hypothetical protein SGILL_001760 [Bacillariaceae sp.]